GRDFNAADLQENAPPVCIVNEAFVRLRFPGEDAMGKPCFTGRRPDLRDTTGGRYSTPPEPYQIVGIVRDSRYGNPASEPRPIIYATFLQTPTGRGQMVLHMRVSGDSALVASHLREEVLRVDRTLPAFDIHTLSQEMDAALIQQRLVAML